MPDVTFLGFDEAWLEMRGGAWTAREICQQPQMLRRTQDILMKRRAEIEAFLAPLLARTEMRIVLTGAGTSAFIGDSLAPWLAAHLKRRVESIATTDIACAPELYLDPDQPTLLVSFGRSGNSPESIAAVELADQCVSEIHHLVITCNADGALAKYAALTPRGFCVLLPEETHDRGFAMTSSYSSMAWGALSCLLGIENLQERVGPVAAAVSAVVADHADTLRRAADQGYDRVVYLGSHVFKGMAREAALKLMELTNGGVATLFDSTLGFRHGPKTFVTAKTLVFVFLSNDPYTRRYDIDLLNELRGDDEAGRIIAVTSQPASDIPDRIVIPGLETAADMDLLFPYIAVAQIFAFQQSLRDGLTPDRPNTKGTVNRVVQGVRIHERV